MLRTIIPILAVAVFVGAWANFFDEIIRIILGELIEKYI